MCLGNVFVMIRNKLIPQMRLSKVQVHLNLKPNS
jgi:hypothetical protein